MYMPPGQVAFRCRRCFNLTYRSAQEHDQRAYDLAKNLSQVETMLESEKIGRKFLAIDAVALALGRTRRRASREWR
jgi:hypothetical protein